MMFRVNEGQIINKNSPTEKSSKALIEAFFRYFADCSRKFGYKIKISGLYNFIFIPEIK